MSGRPKKCIENLIGSMEQRNLQMEKKGTGQRAQLFLFTKIPRTASESMHGVFSYNVLNYIRINQPNHAKQFYATDIANEISVCHNHTPVAGLVKAKCIPTAAFMSRFSFTFIRNPWSRLLSVFNLLSHWESNGKKTLIQGSKTVSEFAELLTRTKHAAGIPASLKFYLTSPQWTWVYPGFTFVGRYEQIAADWAYVNQQLGTNIELNRHTKFYTKTASMEKPPEEQYTDRAAKIVAKLYEDDCYLGGYDDVTSKCVLTSDEILSRCREIYKSKVK